MPNRIRAALIASLTIISSLMAAAPAGAVVTPQKVVIIVGPTGALTDNYRSKGDSIAAAAEAAGATAVKVYSPNATWANVKAAVNGANIVIYLGHGNGYPNPYNTGAEPTDRDNGWGLNRTTTNGDGDNWNSTMVYCGEKALLGTLTSGSTAQWAYCGGSTNTDGITPAPNWVMIYSNACYAPGASEGWDVPATESVALQRVRNYSYPGLVLGGGAYFATDMHEGAQQLVDKILRNPGMPFGAIAENANGYDLSDQVHFAHPDLSGTRVWIQNTGTPTSGDYFFAYAGKPGLTPSGTTVAYTEPTPTPPPPPPGTTTYNPAVPLVFKMGTHTAYQFSSTGAMTAQKSYTLPNDQSASTSVRTTITNQAGTWFYIVNGEWAGYWMRESSTLYLASAPVAALSAPNATYNPAVPLVFKMGTHTAYQFSSTGAMTAQKSYTLPNDQSASTSVRTTITNQAGTWFYIVNGEWAGYWMRWSDVLYLASPTPTPTPTPTPPPPPPGTTTYNPAVPLVFKMGTHTAYQFSSTGAMTAQKSYTLPNDQSASTSVRTTITNQAGTWFYIVNGEWAGYWMRESSTLYLASAPVAALSAPNATYNPAVPLVFKMGTHTAYQFSSTGAMTAQKSYTLPNDQSASTSVRTTITNQAGTWFYIVNGEWAGYWMRWSDVLYLKP